MPGDRTVHIEGICGDVSESSVTTSSEVTFTFLQIDNDGFGTEWFVTTGPDRTAYFGELETAADDLIIGLPQLLAWGLSISRGEDQAPLVVIGDLNDDSSAWSKPTCSYWQANPEIDPAKKVDENKHASG